MNYVYLCVLYKYISYVLNACQGETFTLCSPPLVDGPENIDVMPVTNLPEGKTRFSQTDTERLVFELISCNDLPLLDFLIDYKLLYV